MITVPPPPYVSAHGLLKDRSVLITAAAGGGIGFAAAQRCAAEGARALLISHIHPPRLDEAVGTLEEKRPDCAVRGRSANCRVVEGVCALSDVPAATLHGGHRLLKNDGSERPPG